ncbi:MAG TPA: lipid-A-disaccharide synthase [Bacteroidales bacterium]|nr:lipid-A-disaccharide synthase [Bacteroidales bacterium]
MKYFIIAGEASGDLHGSHLVEQIKFVDKNADFEGWGGDLLIKQGVKVHKHIRDLAFMGFVEVLQNLSEIRKNFRLCKKQITEYNPDAVIFVDYPGFNLRLAKWVKKHSYKSIYFISPNVWAWKASRVYKIRDYTDKMYVILPFEKDFYAKYGIEVEYYGHPLTDIIKNYLKKSDDDFHKEHNLDLRPIIALMAGSRKQEIKHMLPVMIEASEEFPEYNFVITGAPAIDKEYYTQFLKNSDVKLVFGQTYEVLSHSIAGLITSGTATLEAALFRLPQVVCYKGGRISVAIARLVANVKYISLVNLILDKNAVCELIQNDLNKENLKKELKKILPNGEKFSFVKDNYITLYKKLDKDNIYLKIAESIKDDISNEK